MATLESLGDHRHVFTYRAAVGLRSAWAKPGLLSKEPTVAAEVWYSTDGDAGKPRRPSARFLLQCCTRSSQCSGHAWISACEKRGQTAAASGAAAKRYGKAKPTPNIISYTAWATRAWRACNASTFCRSLFIYWLGGLAAYFPFSFSITAARRRVLSCSVVMGPPWQLGAWTGQGVDRAGRLARWGEAVCGRGELLP